MKMPRRPKPIHLQLAEGDPRKRGARKLREALEGAPKPVQGFNECPNHLHGLTRATWDFLAGELSSMGLDFRPDGLALTGACTAYNRAIQADKIIHKEGLVVQEFAIDKTGVKVLLKTRPHPAVGISNSAWRQFRMFAAEFGLSPASRTGLTIDPNVATRQTEQRLDAMLSQPRVSKCRPQ
jgi:P27 family predicted phage terminase small subunit